MTKKRSKFPCEMTAAFSFFVVILEKCIKRDMGFAIKCQKTLAKCAKCLYNNDAILCNAFFVQYSKEACLCPTVYFRV